MSHHSSGYNLSMTPLQMYAVTVHELFTAFIEAGFTETQAMYLTAQRINVDVRE